MPEFQLSQNEINVLSVITKNRKRVPHDWLRDMGRHVFPMSGHADDIMEIILREGVADRHIVECPFYSRKYAVAMTFLNWWDDVELSQPVDNSVDNLECQLPNRKSSHAVTVRTPESETHASTL